MKTRKDALDMCVVHGDRLRDALREAGIPPDALDLVYRLVENAKLDVQSATANPRQVAVEQAWALGQNWGHPDTVSRVSLWHQRAAAFLGVKNETVALTRHMHNLRKTLKTDVTAGSALAQRLFRVRPI
jgi:hypothetical protein